MRVEVVFVFSQGVGGLLILSSRSVGLFSARVRADCADERLVPFAALVPCGGKLVVGSIGIGPVGGGCSLENDFDISHH